MFEEHYREEVPRYRTGGIPAFFIVASALLLERIYGLASKNRLIYLLGESSYIVYLVHPYIVFTVLRKVLKHHAPSALSSTPASRRADPRPPRTHQRDRGRDPPLVREAGDEPTRARRS